MPLSGGPIDWGNTFHPYDVWLRLLEEHAKPDPPREPALAPISDAQPQYRTSCVPCLLAIQGAQWNIDAGLNDGDPRLCGDHERALADMDAFSIEDLMDFLAGLRAWVTRAQ